jgi:hypothetical protein
MLSARCLLMARPPMASPPDNEERLGGGLGWV